MTQLWNNSKGSGTIIKHSYVSSGKCMDAHTLNEMKSMTSFLSFQVSSVCQMSWDQAMLFLWQWGIFKFSNKYYNLKSNIVDEILWTVKTTAYWILNICLALYVLFSIWFLIIVVFTIFLWKMSYMSYCKDEETEAQGVKVICWFAQGQASEWLSQVEDIADQTLTIIFLLLLPGIIALLQSPPFTTELWKKSVL